MSERELNRQVSRATGEPFEQIAHMGFHVVNEDLNDDGPLVIDWDVGRPDTLGNILSDDDWPGPSGPLPSYDEELEDEFAEEYVCAAA